MSPLIYLLIIATCIALSAFFSSSETALLRLTEEQIDRDLKKKPSPGMLAAQDLIKLGKSRMNGDATTLAAGYGSVLGFNLRQVIRHKKEKVGVAA